MSFADRMHAVRTEAELRQLMLEVRESGSPNWIIGAAKAKVRDEFWDELRRHFDEDGWILPAPTEAERLEQEGSPYRTSIFALVREINERLRDARRLARGRVEAQREVARAQLTAEDTAVSTGVPEDRGTTEGEELKPPAELMDYFAPTPSNDEEKAPGDWEAEGEGAPHGAEVPEVAGTEESRSYCPVCARDVAKLVEWEGKPICPECSRLLR